MRLGILVHFRGLQLENKERKGMLVTHASRIEQVGIQSTETLLLCLTPIPKTCTCAGKQLSLGRHSSPSQPEHV